MSGRKNYPVNRYEMDRELRSQRQAYEDRIAQAEREFQRELEDRDRLGERRNQEWKKKIEKMDRKIQDAEQRFHENLQNLEQRFDQSLEQVKTYVDESMKDLRNELQLEREDKETAAREWLQVNEYLGSELDSLQVARFKPAEHQKMRSLLEYARLNLREGHFEAVITQSQQSYMDGFPLRAELEGINVQAALLERAVVGRWTSVQRTLDMDQKVERTMHTSSGDTETAEVDLAFWAQAEWQALQERARVLQCDVEKVSTLDLPRLAALEQDLKHWHEEYLEVRLTGLGRHFSSIATMDWQEEISLKLEQLGFEVMDNFFEGEDERGTNVLLLENAEGEKILVRVVPTSQGQDIKVSFNTLNTVTHSARFDALNKVIGVSPEEEPGYEHRPAPAEDFDLKRYGRKQR